jgi:hypothetical protein
MMLLHLAHSVMALQQQLRPGYLHVMLDIRGYHCPRERLQRVLATGIDSLLVNIDSEVTNTAVIRDSQYRPLQERRNTDAFKDDTQFRLWEVAAHDLNGMARLAADNKEAFVLCGDDSFVVQAVNERIPAGAKCLWRPPSSMARSLLIRLHNGNPLSVWRLRSNPGILGMVFGWQDIVQVCRQPPNEEWDAVPLYVSLKKMRQPCSAMDYPPTIYMIGEDETS